MSGSAQVTSVDAIEIFRASLVLYLSKARPAIQQVCAEAQRTRIWVQTTQRQFWDHQLRLRQRKLEEAKEALFNARISQFNQSTLLETMAVQRAQRAVEEAEQKLVMLKKWAHEIENRADPLVKQLDQFHAFLSTDMGDAVVLLAELVKALDAYTNSVSMGGGPAATPPPSGGEPPAPEPGAQGVIP
jgi:hypothetical protein